MAIDIGMTLPSCRRKYMLRGRFVANAISYTAGFVADEMYHVSPPSSRVKN
ncbi:hypothetical protein ACT7CW_26980 [Bacillus pacificus]